jgi:ParB family chromosome partitioning protein
MSAARERGLGRGLGALLGEAGAAVPGHEPAMLATADLAPGPFQPRRNFDEDELESLSASIRERGIMQPILVRPDPKTEGRYEIVAGERRWRAAQRAQLHEVPVIIRELDDRDSLEVALIENVQRQDLGALEEAEGYHRLIEEFDLTQESLARQVGKSRSHVTNMLRLLGLPEAVREMVDTRELSPGHARALLTAQDPEALAKTVQAKGLNVRQTEALVKRAAAGLVKALKAKVLRSPDTVKLEKDLTAALGMRVQIVERGEAGELRITYRSLEQLDDLIRRVRD